MNKLIILVHRKEYLLGLLTTEIVSAQPDVETKVLEVEEIKYLHPPIYNYPHSPIFENYQEDKSIIRQIPEGYNCIVTVEANGIKKRTKLSLQQGKDSIYQLF